MPQAILPPLPAEAKQYIHQQRIAILSIEMMDGAPHAAALHYAPNSDGSKFFFVTSPSYRKAEPLTGRPESRASLVIGTNEEEMKTLQMDGVVHIVSNPAEQTEYAEIYWARFPEKLEKFGDGTKFVFTPTWWRYTDFKAEGGKKIISAED